MRNKIINIFLFSVIIFQIILLINNQIKKSNNNNIAQPILSLNKEISIEYLPKLGNGSIGLIEFSDFECPFCKKFNKETFPQIKKNLIETNKISYYFVNNPLPSHKNAIQLAKIGICSSNFWEVRTSLYDFEPSSLNCGGFKVDEILKRDAALVKEFNIQGTPSFILGKIKNNTLIETKLIRGALPYEIFEQEINLLQ